MDSAPNDAAVAAGAPVPFRFQFPPAARLRHRPSPPRGSGPGQAGTRRHRLRRGPDQAHATRQLGRGAAKDLHRIAREPDIEVTLKDLPGCISAVDTWLRRYDSSVDTKPRFLTETCSPLAEIWLKTWRAGVAANYREEIMHALAKHIRRSNDPRMLPQRSAAARDHAQFSRVATLSIEEEEDTRQPAKQARCE